MKLSERNRLYAGLYELAQSGLSIVIKNLMATLEAFGAISAPHHPRFMDRRMPKFRTMILRLSARLRMSDIKQGFSGIRVVGPTTADHPRTVLSQMLMGFGCDDIQTANMLANQLLNTELTNQLLNTELTVSAAVGQSGIAIEWYPVFTHELQHRLRVLFGNMCKLYDRLKSRLMDVMKPYCGKPDDPLAGLFQLMDLLSEFPDIAPGVYGQGGISNVQGIPPQAIGTVSPDSAADVLIHDARLWLRHRKLTSYAWMGALLVAGVVITVVSAGALSPVAGAAIGLGYGVAQSGVHIGMAHSACTEAEDAMRFGAASQGTVDARANDVIGAYGGLVVNIATIGLLARFGATGTASAIGRHIVITTINMGSGAASTAVNPNVWHSDHTLGLIVTGTVVGGLSGIVGSGISSATNRAANRFVPPEDFVPVEIGVPWQETTPTFAIKPGIRVMVSVDARTKPFVATVRSQSNGKVILMTDSGATVTVKLAGTAKLLLADLFDQAPLRPLTRSDIKQNAPLLGSDQGPRDVRVRVPNRSGGRDIAGHVEKPSGPSIFMHGGRKANFKSDGGESSTVKLSQTNVPHFDLMDAMGLGNAGDLRRLWFNYSQDYRIQQSGHEGYFTLTARSSAVPGPKLMIISGQSNDWNDAFFMHPAEAIGPKPLIRIRNRPASPPVDEIAMFCAHGDPSGFTEITTKAAADAIVDAIVGGRTTGSKNVKFIWLDACQQANPGYMSHLRVLISGRLGKSLPKTNAQVFQEHVNQRLCELGIDPGGHQGLTVLSANRMGATAPQNVVAVGGDTYRVHRKVPWVPATEQKSIPRISDVMAENVAEGIARSIHGVMKQTKQVSAAGLGLVGLVVVGRSQRPQPEGDNGQDDGALHLLEYFTDAAAGARTVAQKTKDAGMEVVALVVRELGY